MKEVEFKIEKTSNLTGNIYEMILSGSGGFTAPGQFINISVRGHFLRRPISVCEYSEQMTKILFRTVGSGTAALSKLNKGSVISALSPLGNGFNISLVPNRAVIIGGGIGIPPLYGLAKSLINKGVELIIGLGFSKAADVFYVKEFTDLGCKVIVATDDGSCGEKGFIIDAVKKYADQFSYSIACGPTAMLKAVYAIDAFKGGQFSLEERMGCGFGACMCCSVKTKSGAKRVCTEGPVFFKEDLI